MRSINSPKAEQRALSLVAPLPFVKHMGDRQLLLTLALIPVCWLRGAGSAVSETLVLVAMAAMLSMEAWRMRGMIELPRSFWRNHSREL